MVDDYPTRFKSFLEDSVKLLADDLGNKGFPYVQENGLSNLGELASSEKYNLISGDISVIRLLHEIFLHDVSPLVKRVRFVSLDENEKKRIYAEFLDKTKLIHGASNQDSLPQQSS